MLTKSATPAEIIAQETTQQQMENHPVIRTLYDHSDVSFSVNIFQLLYIYMVVIQFKFDKLCYFYRKN